MTNEEAMKLMAEDIRDFCKNSLDKIGSCQYCTKTSFCTITQDKLVFQMDATEITERYMDLS